MMVINTQRHYAEHANLKMFVYINNLKHTHLINIGHCDKTSNLYLNTRLIHCLLDEVELTFKKKLINTHSKNVTIKMSYAAGIAFYKTLLALPVPADDVYSNLVRNSWIEILDQQILLAPVGQF